MRRACLPPGRWCLRPVSQRYGPVAHKGLEAKWQSGEHGKVLVAPPRSQTPLACLCGARDVPHMIRLCFLCGFVCAEHVGSKTAVQIRSHAQKFFTKIEKSKEAGSIEDGEVASGREFFCLCSPRTITDDLALLIASAQISRGNLHLHLQQPFATAICVAALLSAEALSYIGVISQSGHFCLLELCCTTHSCGASDQHPSASPQAEAQQALPAQGLQLYRRPAHLQWGLPNANKRHGEPAHEPAA